MSSLQSTRKKCFRAKVKSKTGSEEGRLYKKIALVLLAKRGYELSKCENSKFCDFAIRREVGIGKDGKFDDIVFSYLDEDNTKNLIFVQIKHKQGDYAIDSHVLYTEAARAKNVGGSDGGKCRDFNLQKYFISYLSVRDELKNTKSEELINGKMKYLVLFTNINLHPKELEETGFSLKDAPDDIVNLFQLSSDAQHPNHCHQFGNVTEGLYRKLKQSSDLERLARELAHYVVWKDYRENRIMGIDETPIKYYHFGLGKYVIEKSDQVEDKPDVKQIKQKNYCEAHLGKVFWTVTILQQIYINFAMHYLKLLGSLINQKKV